MTPYHIIGFLITLNVFLLLVILKLKKNKVEPEPLAAPMKDGRTTRYAWIRLHTVLTNDMYYTDTHKPGVQVVTLKTNDLNRHYADAQISSMNTAWIEHGIEFDPKKQ